jgi:hypothetical protein
MLGMSAGGERAMRFAIGILAVEPIAERLDLRMNHHSPAAPAGDHQNSRSGHGAGVGEEVRWGMVEAGRLEVTIAAYLLGYFLLDTVEVADGEDAIGPGWARVRRLAMAIEADALLIHGPVKLAVVEPFAAQFRLVVRTVRDVLPSPPFHPPPGPPPSTSEPSGSSSGLGAWGAAPQPPSSGRTGR